MFFLFLSSGSEKYNAGPRESSRSTTLFFHCKLPCFSVHFIQYISVPDPEGSRVLEGPDQKGYCLCSVESAKYDIEIFCYLYLYFLDVFCRSGFFGQSESGLGQKDPDPKH